MSGKASGILFLPCRMCGRMRTLTLNLYAGDIRAAMDRPCLTCAMQARSWKTPAGHQATRAAELAGELAWMQDTPENAARRLGTTVGALARLFYRAGMPEQARPFMRAIKSTQKRQVAA